MKIILVNDDGIQSPGIWALANDLKADHEIVLAAPESERSGYSHSITIHTQLKARAYPAQGMRAYEVSGTPADCTILARGVLMPDAELVISGINRGHNAGSDVHYSGTVGAAVEAAMYGMPAIAVSADFTVTDFAPTLKYTRRLIEYVREHGLAHGELLNLNLPAGEPKGLRYAPTGTRYFNMKYEPSDPDDGWITYAISRRCLPNAASGTDLCLLDEGYATVTKFTTSWSAAAMDLG